MTKWKVAINTSLKGERGSQVSSMVLGGGVVTQQYRPLQLNIASTSTVPSAQGPEKSQADQIPSIHVGQVQPQVNPGREQV